MQRPIVGQILIGAGAILVPTVLLYLLVLLWPQDAPKARYVEPRHHAADTR